jgi:rSAM/selenodomain-associated transferase 2
MSVSVIIPTLNEVSCLAETLISLKEQQPHQIIVVDGGSQDTTCEIASTSNHDVLVLHSPPGRARQMNLGAAHATCDVLVFLHADCQLESGALEAAEKCLQKPKVVAGCFQMHVDAPGGLYRWIDAWASARVRITCLIYGDQGLFLRREDFHRLGGFPIIRLMEDVFFSRTLRNEGRIIALPKRIYVSPRRWKKAGVIRQTLRNWTLMGLAAGGIHPDRLAAFYPETR